MKISIIVPMYNTEKYIEKCIESVLNIQEIDYELIIVNDGSTDNSVETIEKYLLSNTKIKLINQDNQGVSVARNTGIIASTGDYIYFLDSDDWIETKSFEMIINDLEIEYNNGNEIDIIIGQEHIHSEYHNYEILDERIPKKLINKTILSKEYMRDSIRGKYWNVRLPIYLYKRELIINNNILFPTNRKSNEDELFTINILYHANKIKITDKIFGYYRARPGSVMSVLNINHAIDIFENIKDLMDKYKNELDKDIRKIIFYMIKKYYKSAMKKAIQCKRKDVFDFIYHQFKLDCKRYLFKTHFKLFENIELYIIYYMKNIYFYILKRNMHN